MAVSCELLSADWGNIADWAGASANWATALIALLALIVAAWGVVFSLLGAVAVAYLGWKANAMNRLAVEHEANQARRAEQLRIEERRLILVSLWSTVSGYRIAFENILKELEQPDGMEKFRTSAKYQNEIGNRLTDKGELLPEGIRSQLHIVGNPTAAEIVRCASVVPLMVAALSGSGLLDAEDTDRLMAGFKAMRQTLTDLTVHCHQAATECGLSSVLEQKG